MGGSEAYEWPLLDFPCSPQHALLTECQEGDLMSIQVGKGSALASGGM